MLGTQEKGAPQALLFKPNEMISSATLRTHQQARFLTKKVLLSAPA